MNLINFSDEPLIIQRDSRMAGEWYACSFKNFPDIPPVYGQTRVEAVQELEKLKDFFDQNNIRCKADIDQKFNS